MNPHRKLKYIVLVLSVFFLYCPAPSQDFNIIFSDNAAESVTDYIKRSIVVTGRGASTKSQTSIAQKKLWALTEARKNCITQAAVAIGKLHVESTTFMEAGSLVGTDFSMQIGEYVQGLHAFEEKTETLSDGSFAAEITLVIDFDGNNGNRGLNALLFSELFPLEESNANLLTENSVIRYSAKSITGLVFDVRDLPIKPSMTPKIYSENGDLIYGPEHVSRDYIERYGIVGYTKDAANVLERIGENPLLLKVFTLHEDNAAHIVLDKDTVEQLAKIDKRGRLLRESRVAFLVK